MEQNKEINLVDQDDRFDLVLKNALRVKREIQSFSQLDVTMYHYGKYSKVNHIRGLINDLYSGDYLVKVLNNNYLAGNLGKIHALLYEYGYDAFLEGIKLCLLEELDNLGQSPKRDHFEETKRRD